MPLLLRRARCCKCRGCVANCAQCTCCECFTCGDDEENAIPTVSIGTTVFTVALSNITIDTACRRMYGTDCVPISGTSAKFASSPYSATLSLKPDIGALPFNTRDPDSVCDHLPGGELCGAWTVQGTLPTIGFKDYTNETCSSGEFAYSLNVYARLVYQATATKHRYILYVFATALSNTVEFPLFLGYADFDARVCANYSAFPLVMSNIITSYASCLCGSSGTGAHPAGKNGTATITLVCPGAGLAMMGEQLRGDIDGAARLIASGNVPDAGAAAQTTKRGCCFEA